MSTSDKHAQAIILPGAVQRQFNDLPDERWTKINIEFYKDSADAVFKALVEATNIVSVGRYLRTSGARK